MKRSRGEMYSGHDRLCVCLSVCPSPHSHTTVHCANPDVTSGDGRGCPLVVHYWADLQSVNEFRCYDNIAPNAKCQQVPVLALCLAVGCSLWPHVGFSTTNSAHSTSGSPIRQSITNPNSNTDPNPSTSSANPIDPTNLTKPYKP